MINHLATAVRRTVLCAGLAAVLILPLGGCGSPALDGPPPDILLITVDTLRADRKPSYAQLHLAAAGVRFTHATVPIPRTTPALASLLTGLEPHHHGSREVGQPIRSDATTLAEILAEHGYRTLAVSASGAASSAQGLDRGFHRFERVDESQPNTAHTTTTVALDLARQTHSTHPASPLLLWVHYIDPHAPYQPPEIWMEESRGRECLDYLDFIDREDWEAGHVFSNRGGRSAAVWESCSYLYDQEIAFTDFEIAALVLKLGQQTGRKPIVIYTADHGENLGEDGLWYQHGPSLHDASLRVPLVIAGPGIRLGRVDHEPARSQDLLPTLLELLDLPQGDETTLDGVSYAARLRGNLLLTWLGIGASAPPVAFAEGGSALMEHNFSWLHSGAAGGFHCLNLGRWSLCEEPGEPPRLFDHEADPDLTTDLGPEHPEVVQRMLAARRHWPPEEARLRAVRTPRFKLVERPLPSGDRTRALYDLESDPAEARDVSADFPQERRRLDRALDAWVAELPQPAPVERSEEEIERLRALGYLR